MPSKAMRIANLMRSIGDRSKFATSTAVLRRRDAEPYQILVKDFASALQCKRPCQLALRSLKPNPSNFYT